jgi:Zn-dependent protease
LAYLTFLVGIGSAIMLSISNPDLSIMSGFELGSHILILLIAFPIHELSHAVVADRLGDPTPRSHGRITLNPFAQLNFIGSLLMLLVGLGWAYVPINPRYLRPNPRLGHVIVAAAGPISNMILAILCALLWHSLAVILPAFGSPALLAYARQVLFFFALFNLALFIFNLIPIAPLDGFSVLKGLLPYNLAYQLERLQRFSMFIFLGVFFIAPLMGLPIVDWLIFRPAATLTALLFGI